MSQELFDVEHFLRSAKWDTLSKLYGSAHSTIIGFLSSSWLCYSPSHFVLDGAPSTYIGSKEHEKRHADLLFGIDKSPFIVVEVESTAKQYEEKLKTLYTYLDHTEDFSGLQFGMLVLLNYTGREDSYQHHWDKLKTVVCQRSHNIVLVSLQKRPERPPFDAKTHDRLSKDTGYYHWVHQSIDFWVHFQTHQVREGHLWPPSATEVVLPQSV